MKTPLLTLVAAFALTAGTAAAQTPAATDERLVQGRDQMQGSPDEMAARQSERMTKELGLNPDQAARVQQILLARGQEMQAMRGQARETANRDQMREQMQAGRAKYDAQFKQVLTADQYAKYTATQAERTNRSGGPGMGGPDPDVNIEKMKAMSEDGNKIKVKVKPVNVK